MSDSPKDRTPLIIQPHWNDWDQFTEHLETSRANDNSAWTRDIDPQQARKTQATNAEIDRALEGLLEPRQPVKRESYLDRLERQQSEKGQTLADLLPQNERDRQRQQEQENGLELDSGL